MITRRQLTLGVAAACAVMLTAGLALVGSDRLASHSAGLSNAISGPYGRLLAESIDLGPAHGDRVQLTAALHRRAEPVLLNAWARAHDLSVRWRDGDDWAVIEGGPDAVAGAFGVAVRDYRAPGAINVAYA